MRSRPPPGPAAAAGGPGAPGAGRRGGTLIRMPRLKPWSARSRPRGGWPTTRSRRRRRFAGVHPLPSARFPVGSAWLARAEGLLESARIGVHARLELFRTLIAFKETRLSEAIEHADRAIALGRAHGNPEAQYSA